MHWINWLLVASLSADILVRIAMIGKPRSPISPIEAAIVFLVHGLLIAGIIVFNGV